MTDLINNASEEELKAVTDYIKNRLEKDLISRVQPWEAFPGGENNSEAIKKRNYLER